MANKDFTNLINHLDLKLYYNGTQNCVPNHCWGPAIKEHYKVHYIHKGKGIFKTGDKTYELEKGQGFLICPNIISYYKADEEDPWEYSWCAFDGVNAETYLRRANLTGENPIFSYDKDVKVSSCFYEMAEALKCEKSKDLKLQSLLYEFLSIIIETSDSSASQETTNSNKNTYINMAIEFVQINYSRNIKVAEIAKYLNLDRKYISLLFKNTVGVTLQQYLIAYRINKAKVMMTDSNLSIGDIARSVGYEDPLVFSKSFKKINGKSPSEFRSKKEQR